MTRAAAWATPVVLSAATAPAYAAASSAGLHRLAVSQILNGKSQQLPVVILRTWATIHDEPRRRGVDVGARTSRTPGPLTAGKRQPHPAEDELRPELPQARDAEDRRLEGDTVTFTLKLSPPVRNFAFTITHIDKTAGLWVNNVVVSPATFSVLTSGAERRWASGTADEPFTGAADKSLATDDPSGDVTVTLPDAGPAW